MAVLRAVTAVAAAFVIKKFKRRPLFLVNGLVVMSANFAIASHAFMVERGQVSQEVMENPWYVLLTQIVFCTRPVRGLTLARYCLLQDFQNCP